MNHTFKTIISIILLTAMPGMAIAVSVENSETRLLAEKVETLHKSGKYKNALEAAETLFKVQDKTLGQDSLELADLCNQLGNLYTLNARSEQAESYLKRALLIREKALGQDSLEIAETVTGLGRLSQQRGRYAEAEEFYKRALAIRERSDQVRKGDWVESLNDMGFICFKTGRYAEAEQLFRRALAIGEKIDASRRLGRTLNNMGLLFLDTERFSESETMFKRALKVRREALGEEHPDVAITLFDFGWLCCRTGKYQEAERMFRKAIQIRLDALGPDHPELAGVYHIMAYLCRLTKRYSNGIQYGKRALEILERRLGPDHPQLGRPLSNLALLYYMTGSYEAAEELANRSLALREKSLGSNHPDIAMSTSLLGLIHAYKGDYRKSHEMFLRGFMVKDRKRENVFAAFSERQKLAFIGRNQQDIEMLIAHDAQFLASDQKAVAESFNGWLQWKGVVAESQARYIEQLGKAETPEGKELAGSFAELKKKLAALQFSKPEELPTAEYREQLEELQRRKERLEARLGMISRSFALAQQADRVDVAAIAGILPGDSAYIDFAEVHLFNFKKKERFKRERRYMAYLLLPGTPDPVKLFDLASADEIDSHIKAYLREMKKPAHSGELPDSKTLARESGSLYAKLIAPMMPYIENRKKLFISPDGNLNLMPFETLTLASNAYMIEKFTISYLSAGRDIVRFSDPSAPAGKAVILADPDFDLGLSEKEREAEKLGVQKFKVRGGVSNDLKNLRFDRLAETREEADSIETILGGRRISAINYQSRKALEEVLFAQHSPRLLHLATHGYFLKKESIETNDELSGIDDSLMSRNSAAIENPMLRSGIVLAGVNAALKEGRDDGMVSAEKILGLDLRGTDMVVLSACETGVGDVQAGEGVFGLKRAFILSGAKTLVMSLWDAPSAETMMLMKDFYARMADGAEKAEALRQAKLAMMKKRPHPFFWGCFVLNGKPD